VREHVQGETFVLQQPFGLPREVVGEVRDREHLHEQRLVPGLAVLADDEVGELVGPVEHQLLEARQHLPALLVRPRGPLLLGGARCRGRFAHLRGSRDAHLPDQLAASRLVHGERAVRRDRALDGSRSVRRADCGPLHRFRDGLGHGTPLYIGGDTMEWCPPKAPVGYAPWRALSNEVAGARGRERKMALLC
jgi:hypothetical protein